MVLHLYFNNMYWLKIHFSGSYLARMSISMSMYKQKDACKIWDSLIGVTEYLNLLEWDIVIWWVVPIVFKTHNAFIMVKYFNSLTLKMKAQSFETSGNTHLMTRCLILEHSTVQKDDLCKQRQEIGS